MMRLLKTMVKGTFKLVGIGLLLLLLTGLSFRLFGPAPHGPTGKLVAVNGVQMHIVGSGNKDQCPTLVVEGGNGMATEFYHWLDGGLRNQMRVVRYDRAGLG